MKKPYVICIVDDDEIYQFTITKIIDLNNLAEKTIVFSDGEEALDFITENLNNDKDLPDIIFLDINMPIMDGFQFIEEYTKLKHKPVKSITVYMVSSSVDPVDIKKAKSISEITGYIIKPIRTSELTQIISSLEKE